MDPWTNRTLLRAAHTTDHFRFDCFNQIIAYTDKSDLDYEIRIVTMNSTECRKLTRSFSSLVPP